MLIQILIFIVGFIIGVLFQNYRYYITTGNFLDDDIKEIKKQNKK